MFIVRMKEHAILPFSRGGPNHGIVLVAILIIQHNLLLSQVIQTKLFIHWPARDYDIL